MRDEIGEELWVRVMREKEFWGELLGLRRGDTGGFQAEEWEE